MSSRAEDGYDLWLRYRPLDHAVAERDRRSVREVIATSSPSAARAELARALPALLGTRPVYSNRVTRDGAILLRRIADGPADAALDAGSLGAEGYLIRSTRVDGHRATLLAANTDAGLLYATFHFLRLLQTGRPVDSIAIREVPRVRHRVLDHWDNLDGTVERGYAGTSIWDWPSLPGRVDPRYVDYARACASIGINGAVATNVNADARSLTPEYLGKAAAIAAALRPYGIALYLTAPFSAPITLGGLATADPLDPAVRKWWQGKVDEIYGYVPDFGGLLIKASSEGQPGPQDYGRTHADGANMLAAALAPHGGIVMWRAFVYRNRAGEDRAMQAYTEFAPLDGRFARNVLLQVKNGPIDFQPREPVHPLFGAMPSTPLMLEFQITKEYLGFATHLVYLGPLFEETLSFDTRANGSGSTVARIVDGSLDRHPVSGMAGVSNVGANRNWTGSHFAQANWYAFGRFAWNPALDAREVAEEWVRMSFSNEAGFVTPVVGMMMGSREAAVDYMTPLGLAHLMAAGHHYGPGPWQTGGTRADWTPPYYHRASREGIGFDRTSHGSDALAQYAPPIAAGFEQPASTPEKYLLWFHHLSWSYRMSSGRSLWEELARHYARGVEYVESMRTTWAGLRPFVDAPRYADVARDLDIQVREARWWRDASLSYFSAVSGLPIPDGCARPEHTLGEYERMSFTDVAGDPANFSRRAAASAPASRD
jgi:alpha-glucuronidase